jgi:hypothetical protein
MVARSGRCNVFILPVPSILGLGVFGVLSVNCGVGVRRGSRGLSRLAYITGAFYLLYFPLGTVLGFILLKGLSGCLKSVERVKAARLTSVAHLAQ